ncbi:MAG: hypothetical protein ACXAEN_25895 [Candidatus Thorarchaeota archaeon]
MWPLENILAMNREARIDEPVNSDGLPYEHLRVKSDPVKAFLRRKALLPTGTPRGQYFYESLDGRLRRISRNGAAMFVNGMLPVTYEIWNDDGVKILVGDDVHTLYWRDEDVTT